MFVQELLVIEKNSLQKYWPNQTSLDTFGGINNVLWCEIAGKCIESACWVVSEENGSTKLWLSGNPSDKPFI